MSREDPEHRAELRGAAAGLVPVALLLIAGGAIALFGQADDLYWYGLVPARWILLVGLVMGVAILGMVVFAVGGAGSAIAVAKWFRRHKRVWLGLFLVAVAIAGIGTWEEYAAPQELLIKGVPNAVVHVRVGGEDPFEHNIEPGSQLEFGVYHGETHITVTCEGRTAEHTVRHEGFRGERRVLPTP